MEILKLKNGSVEVSKIEEYNQLQQKLKGLRRRLQCVTGNEFNCEYFKLGNYSSSSCYEDKDYIILRKDNVSEMKLKQEIIDFLTTKFIEQINEVITKINNLLDK